VLHVEAVAVPRALEVYYVELLAEASIRPIHFLGCDETRSAGTLLVAKRVYCYILSGCHSIGRKKDIFS
jgi:hypothetical protein